MELQDLEAAFRQRIDDEAEPYLVSSVRAAKFASEAEREACIRARLIHDATTEEICEIAVVAATHTYTLDSRILEIDSITLDSEDKPLIQTDQSTLYRGDREWKTRTGTPTHFIRDGKKIRLYPIPEATDELQLDVYRLPLDDMEGDSDEPEIPVEHHDGLIDWMLYRAYSSKDSELYDPSRAKEAEAAFERSFGRKPSADTQRTRQEGRRWTTNYGGIR